MESLRSHHMPLLRDYCQMEVEDRMNNFHLSLPYQKNAVDPVHKDYVPVTIEAIIGTLPSQAWKDVVSMICTAFHSTVVQTESVVLPRKINELDDIVKEVLVGDGVFLRMCYSLATGHLMNPLTTFKVENPWMLSKIMGSYKSSSKQLPHIDNKQLVFNHSFLRCFNPPMLLLNCVNSLRRFN